MLITSMNKGQLPVLAFAFVLALIVWRMPAEEVGKLAFRILERFEQAQLIGWLLNLVLLGLWFLHAKWLRRVHAAECERIGREKSKLQDHAAGKQFAGVKSGK